jgi:hypothetical protein
VLNIVNEPKVIGQQLDLFTPERWPKKPYCSDDKSAKWIRQLKTAIKQPYIQANPPHLRVWMIFDLIPQRKAKKVSITIQKFPPFNIQFFPVSRANQGL